MEPTVLCTGWQRDWDGCDWGSGGACALWKVCVEAVERLGVRWSCRSTLGSSVQSLHHILHSTVLYVHDCTVLYCTALYYTVLCAALLEGRI